jgi:hypothetical protein
MIFVKIQKILIKKSKKNILIKYNGRIIYNSKLKVSLFKGEEAFDDAIKDLKNSKKKQIN